MAGLTELIAEVVVVVGHAEAEGGGQVAEKGGVAGGTLGGRDAAGATVVAGRAGGSASH